MPASDVLARGKYAPLAEYLLSIPQQQREVAMSFSEMESVLGSPLPSSAHEYHAWWANQTDNEDRPQARAWMSARFVVDPVDLKKKFVRFTRLEQQPETQVDDFGVPTGIPLPFETATPRSGNAASAARLDARHNILALVAAGLLGLILGLMLGSRRSANNVAGSQHIRGAHGGPDLVIGR